MPLLLGEKVFASLATAFQFAQKIGRVFLSQVPGIFVSSSGKTLKPALRMKKALPS